jgi:hypothetical protein
LHVLADVWVVPIDAGVAKVYAIDEARARGDSTLGDVGNAVEAIVEPYAMPVDCRRLVETILEPHNDSCALRHTEQWPWVLAIKGVGEDLAASNVTPHD